MKRCSKCKLVKPDEEFHKWIKWYLYPSCKACRKLEYLSPESKLKCYYRNIKSKYDLSFEQFIKIYKSQDGVCKICENPGKLHIDHCRRTNRVRGLLCRCCNTGLGMFKDDVNVLQKAINYLI